MVTGIHIAVVFEGQRTSAGFAKHAASGWFADAGRKLLVKDVDKYIADVSFYPGIENRGEELAIGAGLNRPWRHAERFCL